MTVAENIKLIRKEKGLTQKQLGEKCGLSEAMIRQYELGLRNPKLENLKKIAKAFGIYVGDLLADNFPEYKDQIMQDFGRKMEDKLKNATVTYKETYGDTYIEKVEELFDLLNTAGQEKAVEQIELLTKIPEYKNEEQ